MARGWIKLQRALVDHWLWKGESFTKAQAWVDLLLHANHKPRKIMIKNSVIQLQIGDQARSKVTLSKRWGWSRNKVRRFLKTLKNETMIEQRSEQHTSVITICNYRKFQIDETPSDTPSDTADGTPNGTDAEHQTEHRGRMLKNDKNDKNDINTLVEVGTSTNADTKPDKPKNQKYKFDADHEELAVRMSNPVKARFSGQKINLEEWADAIRKLMEIDKRQRQDIIDLWVWIVNHPERNGFTWADNCRTPMKLRERKDGLQYFEIIQNQMRREQNASPIHGQYSRVTAQNIKNLEAFANGN